MTEVKGWLAIFSTNIQNFLPLGRHFCLLVLLR